MERMEVRGKIYCQIEANVWQLCPTHPTALASVPPGGGGLAVVAVVAMVGVAVVAVVVDYRRRQIQDAIATLDEVA